MKRLFCHISVVLVIVFIIGCGKTSKFRSRLVALDSVLVVHPDSVYTILGKMRSEAKGESYSDYMYYELIYADAQNKAYVDFESDSIMTEVAEYYDTHGSPNEKMRAHYLLGCTYRDLKDVPKELQCFQDAVETSDTTSTKCDLYTLTAIYGQMADIYDMQNLPQEELNVLSECEKFALKDKDTITAISAYELKLRAYFLLNNTDSVLSISENAKKRYLEIGDTSRAAVLLGPAISILIDRGDYMQAYHYMQMFKKHSGYFTGNEITSPEGYIHYRSMGRYALHCGDIGFAKFCFDKLLEKGLKEAGYQGLLLVYQQKELSDSVVKYSRLYASANDSSHINLNTETIAQMTAMYNYGREKRLAESAKELLLAEKGKSMTMLFVIFSLFVSVVVLIYIVNRIRKNNVKRIILLNREIEHKTLLLNEALKNGNKDELERLNVSLDKAQCELRKYKKADALAAFFESEIYNLFKNVSIKGNDVLTSEEWGTMARLFDTTFSSYIDFVHSGKSMTPDQIKVCMLIRMGFGESEMGNIMNVDLKRITRIKMQINQKLFNVSNARDLVPNLKPYF